MSNPLSTIRAAVWTALDADSALTTLMAAGTKYKLDSGGKLPNVLTKSDCPILIVYPGSVPSGWATSHQLELTYSMPVRCIVASGVADDAEEMFWTVYKAVLAAYPSLSSTSGVISLACTAPNIRSLFAGGQSYFITDFKVEVRFRNIPTTEQS